MKTWAYFACIILLLGFAGLFAVILFSLSCTQKPAAVDVVHQGCELAASEGELDPVGEG